LGEVMYPVTEPGEGAAGKTGNWRWQKPIIIIDKCVKCGLCWVYCPEPAIYLDKMGYPHVNYEWCKGCGICAHECPSKAIEMVSEYE